MIKVFYNPKQNVNLDLMSPSAGKPAVVARAFSEYSNVELVSNFKPASLEDICLAHDKKHVLEILELKKPNGFDDQSKEVALSLPWTLGSMAEAALYAYKNNAPTISLTSGFHHAGYDYCGGYCTFNGLMIAALKCMKAGVERIGIIDLDAHYGDGTDHIIEKFKLKNRIDHLTFGGDLFKGEKSWFRYLNSELKKLKKCGLLIYQAGADPHLDDPLGGYLSTESMQLRDKIVFDFALKFKIPICWNLAGGYQDPIAEVVKIHVNTLKTQIKCQNDLF